MTGSRGTTPLNEPRIVIAIRQSSSLMDMETQLGAFACLCDEVIERLPGHRALKGLLSHDSK